MAYGVHPECGDDEVFVTNADDGTFAKVGWRTKRKGSVAYTGSGKVVGKQWPGSFPVFVKKSEIMEVDPSLLDGEADD